MGCPGDALVDQLLADLAADAPADPTAWTQPYEGEADQIPTAPAPQGDRPLDADPLLDAVREAAIADAARWVRDTSLDDLGAELIVEPGGGVRQAGATGSGQWAVDLRRAAERDLYVFARAILHRDYLTRTLHKPVCDWLTDLRTHRRKLLLMPRETAKTSLVGHALPLHVLIQPDDEQNIYFPGEPGAEQRIVLAGKTERRAKDALGVQRAAWESNELLRAFWPHRCWPHPRKDADTWNNVEYTIPRATAWPDPSVRALGVGAALAGVHPSGIVKDDLINEEDANSEVTMAAAIDWHRLSRATMNKATAIEWIIGTRWATHDLYSEILAHDPTVQVWQRALLEDGRCIYPEGFAPTKIAELQAGLGPMFMLLYMNSAADPLLADFDLGQLRTYRLDGTQLVVADDARDFALQARQAQPTAPRPPDLRGRPLAELVGDDPVLRRRLGHFRLTAT